MAKKRELAWHFVGDTLRDGRPVPPDGEWLLHPGKLILCEEGLHWSRQPFDALNYAPGPILCLVEIGGTIHEPKGEDKGISSQRKIIARMDATELMRYFARMQALSVTHLWADADDPDDVVLEYLLTGENRDAARAAARAAAWDAARDAAWDDAWAAACDAARAAARAAAWDDAWDDARAAARAAARQHFNQLVFESFADYL
jgi:hypothetical protein